jgi:hypothetical protein
MSAQVWHISSTVCAACLPPANGRLLRNMSKLAPPLILLYPSPLASTKHSFRVYFNFHSIAATIAELRGDLAH